MGLLSNNFQSFTQSLGQVDATLSERCPFDKKTDELMRFALSIKARSKPCVRKHYRGSVKAGASHEELAYVFALTMREAAGADECWTASVINDLVEAGPAVVGGCG